MANILANSISNKPHLSYFDEMIKQRFNILDYSNVLINLVDNSSVEALPFLFRQFNILGYKGLRFVTTESEKRELIKRAIELHRYKGTFWSIRESLKLIGVNDCELVRGTYVFMYDGKFKYNATQGFTQNSWATFSVKINSASFTSITTPILNDLVNIINEYKSCRSKLVSIIFKGSLYNAVNLYNGSITYSAEIYEV